ncbi:L,D-transpeptidase [Psychroserpens luteus]|uniref:L,D-transpeptidase n=1 Tax=Psychroserpens luteus TaxID=1434066 RepID=A0ABW5ZVS9_9FLAO|nr:L,D-transpeptidase [Psychroserpens luteus]
MLKTGLGVIVVIILLTVFSLYSFKDNNVLVSSSLKNSAALARLVLPANIEIKKNVTISNYFEYLDSIVFKYDSLTSYKLTEHLLVRANPWIIDTLQNTDYYRMMARDSFVYDQKKMIALAKGSLMVIPDSIQAKTLLSAFQKTTIDINIPEFKLRIYEDTIQLYEFPIRVGRNEKKYLKMSGRVQDLKTKTGEGYIVNYVRDARYANPVNNHEYFVTNRDDKKVTKLPRIPFIETEINGLRYGQLIHPTTNPESLGKAYSNGCIGTREGDAWIIYYHASINTAVKIRYDLNVVNEKGDTIVLKDIYGYNKKN